MGWRGEGWQSTQNDLFIPSGIHTGHELKNDRHFDKFPFVRNFIISTPNSNVRLKLPSPVRESIYICIHFFQFFFSFLRSHIPSVRCSVFLTLSHFEPVANLINFLCAPIFHLLFFRSFVRFHFFNADRRRGAKCILVVLLGLAFS